MSPSRRCSVRGKPLPFSTIVEELSLGLTRKHLLTHYRMMMQTEPEVFGAISHTARRRMLDLLALGDRSVNAIAANFEMSRPAASQHLRVLLDAGLVTEQRHGRERRYRLAPQRLARVPRRRVRHDP